MLITRNNESRPAKGWCFELAHEKLPFIGFANQGIHEPHYHQELYEVYLVARGNSTMLVDNTPVKLHAGDVIVLEPGEVHTFIENSEDYFHFVLHCPPAKGDKVVIIEDL